MAEAEAYNASQPPLTIPSVPGGHTYHVAVRMTDEHGFQSALSAQLSVGVLAGEPLACLPFSQFALYLGGEGNEKLCMHLRVRLRAFVVGRRYTSNNRVQNACISVKTTLYFDKSDNLKERVC